MELPNSIAKTKEWFEKAIPNPTDKNISTQIGCHLEEVAEMLNVVHSANAELNQDIIRIGNLIDNLATVFKSEDNIRIYTNHREEFLDSLLDQIVTAVGVGHMLGMDTTSGLEEVNRSNFSKFVKNEPLFNENNKIMKGPDYSKPVLTDYV